MATTAGITSFSYFSSTMKHSRVGVVSAGPAIVDITEEMPRRVTVLCLLELDIRATYLVVWGRPLPAWYRLWWPRYAAGRHPRSGPGAARVYG